MFLIRSVRKVVRMTEVRKPREARWWMCRGERRM